MESKTSLEFKDSRDINFKQNMTRSNKIVIENKNSSDDNFFDLPVSGPVHLDFDFKPDEYIKKLTIK